MPLTLTLKGWKQIVAALLFAMAALAGYSAFLQRSLDSKLRPMMHERVKMDLGTEIVRRTIPLDQKEISVTRKQAESLEKDYQRLETLRITSVHRRGWGASLVVQVKFTVGNASENPAEQIRYYRLKHVWFGGWFVRSHSTEAAYRLGWLL